MTKVETQRRVVTAAELVNIILGIWVAISAFVLGFSHNPISRWNNIAVGIALVLVALASKWENEALEGLAVPLAIWLFSSAFVLGIHTTAFMANNASMAFVVVTAAAISEGLRLPKNPKLHRVIRRSRLL